MIAHAGQRWRRQCVQAHEVCEIIYTGQRPKQLTQFALGKGPVDRGNTFATEPRPLPVNRVCQRAENLIGLSQS
jgi:hypothetical protein